MPKELLERTSEHRQEATQESRDKFLYNIDVLTERAKESSGFRWENYILSDGRRISAHYTTAEEIERIEKGIEPWREDIDDPIKAHLSIVEEDETLDSPIFKQTIYDLHKSGAIERHSAIRDSKKEMDEIIAEDEALEKGRLSLSDFLKAGPEKAKKALADKEEDRKMGMAFVSEADLKELNSLLEKAIEEEKEKRKK